MLMLVVVVSILLILIGSIGLGIIAWPLLIVYIALILLSISISSFVVGTTVYELIKNKLGKYKIPVLVGIFAVIYTLTQIVAIKFYVLSAINIVSLAIILTYIFKREKDEVK